MIYGHEGLPGSGKSYEAVVCQIIPALKKGRKVYARIDGLNYEKISDLAQISLEECKNLLTHIEESEVLNIHRDPQPQSLIVLDEAQNYWPQKRQPLEADITKFIAEHRHHGIDIVLMSQNFKDVHSTWRRRIDKKYTFMKLDALGSSKRYRLTVEQQLPGDRWEKIQTKIQTYDTNVFGAYASHVSEEISSEGTQDKRATIWNSSLFKFGIPFTAILAFVSIGYITHLFSGGMAEAMQPQAAEKPTTPVKQSTVSQPTYSQPQPVVQPTPAKLINDPPPPPPQKEKTYLQKLNDSYTVRLTGVLFNANGKAQGTIEFYDSSLRAKERLDFDQINDLGYQVSVGRSGKTVTIYRDREILATATMWPIDPFGQVSERQTQKISEGASRPPSSAALTQQLVLN